MSELEQVRKKFHIIGTCQLAASGRSVRFDITNDPSTVFDKVLYVSREQLVQILHGHRKTATVFTLEPDYEEARQVGTK